MVSVSEITVDMKIGDLPDIEALIRQIVREEIAKTSSGVTPQQLNDYIRSIATKAARDAI